MFDYTHGGTLIAWMETMFGNRKIKAEQVTDRVTALARKSHRKGEELSPHLWILTADELLDIISGYGVHVLAYTDDI